jgi:hypothetical protein
MVVMVVTAGVDAGRRGGDDDDYGEAPQSE